MNDPLYKIAGELKHMNEELKKLRLEVSYSRQRMTALIDKLDKLETERNTDEA